VLSWISTEMGDCLQVPGIYIPGTGI